MARGPVASVYRNVLARTISPGDGRSREVGKAFIQRGVAENAEQTRRTQSPCLGQITAIRRGRRPGPLQSMDALERPDRIMTFCLGITVEQGLIALADTRVVAGNECLVAKKTASYQGPGFSF